MTTLDQAHSEMVRQAQAGDQGSFCALAQPVRERVYAFLNRVTLDSELAGDLTQDTLVAVLQALPKLKDLDRFWPWVFRIAANKARQHYRRESLRKAVSMTTLGDDTISSPAFEGDAAGALSRAELAEMTRAAMARLPERYRMALSLRFYENMRHAQISVALECSPLAARAILLRAKAALKKELRRQGVPPTAFVIALVAFGQATIWPGSAVAVTVTGAAGLVGGALVTKGLLATVAAAMLASVIGYSLLDYQAAPAGPGSGPVRGVHFSQHSYCPISNELDFGPTGSAGLFEQWYWFGQGATFFRMQRWDPAGTQRLCWWLENQDGNYYVRNDTVFRRNFRHYNRATACLPTDPPELAKFIRNVEGGDSWAMLDHPGLAYQRDSASGVVIAHEDRRFPELGIHRCQYEYGEPDSKLLEIPSGLDVVDERDEMHRRGWAAFQLEGEIAGRKLSGSGELPFILSTSREHPAKLALRINDTLIAGDDGKQAIIRSADGQIRSYPGGGLFRGLGRPWMGFHTVDTIRRDAAAERVWFAAEFPQPDRLARVTLIDDRLATQYMLRYTVDLQRDVLEQIEIWSGVDGRFEKRVMQLTFRYDVATAAPPFTSPVKEVASAPQAAATVLWPVELLRAVAPAGAGPQ